MEKLLIIILLLVFALGCVALCAEPRHYGGTYSKQRIANLRRNCERFDWARSEKDAVLKAAEPWVMLSDLELWEMVPGQDLPRCIDVGWDYNKTPKRVGCVQCGDDVHKFGNYPYEPDFQRAPWKLKCPSCGSIFPTNDFGKYYRSAINDKGLFDPSKGDRSLLYNANHPDPADPLHKWGVDDGYGYTDQVGRTHKYIGYYTWKLLQRIRSGIYLLASAYLYTGDPVYARKAAIMLDRIADVYPDMDWKKYGDMGWFHSDGGSRRGKIEGRIWETNAVSSLADSYDRILSGTLDNPELYTFLAEMGRKYSLPRAKGTRADFISNVDDNLLRCALQGVLDGRVWGNEGMHQNTVAVCAIALDTQPETGTWLDWIFSEKGGHVPSIIMGGIDRDGLGGEGAPGYSMIWGDQIGLMANRIADYGKYDRHDVYRDFPQFRSTLTASSRICVLNLATPSIGDSGSTGSVAKARVDAARLAQAFERLGDPEIAAAAVAANGGTSRGLRGSIWSAEPEKLPQKIDQAAARASGAGALKGTRNLAGFGLASLEKGSGTEGTALWMYYGRMDKHGHQDRLNIGLYAFGVDLAPDLGYPEYAADWPPRLQWNNNTISHNTLMIDSRGQERTLHAFPTLYASAPFARAFEVSSPNVYPHLHTYSRLIALIDSPRGSYGVDLFRAVGGADHLLSFHGPAGQVTTSGLDLAAQGQGTYAGAEVTSGDTSHDSGFSYLYNVQRDPSPPQAFWIDWLAKDYRGLTGDEKIHLRWHFASPSSEVALADGDPAQNKEGNPRRLRYALVRRQQPGASADLESAFASVLEPYKGEPFIESVSRLRTSDAPHSAAALKIAFKGGGADLIAVAPASGGGISTRDGLALDSGFGFVRVRHGKVVKAFVAGGKTLRFGDFRLTSPGAFTGKVVRMDKDASGEAYIWLSGDITSAAAIAGSQVIIKNDGAANACYDVRSAAKENGLWKVSCGRVSFARGYVDPSDYSKGLVYNFSEGDSFSIPVWASWEAQPQ